MLILSNNFHKNMKNLYNFFRHSRSGTTELKLRDSHRSFSNLSRMSDKTKFSQFPLATLSEWMIKPNFSVPNLNAEFFNYARWCLLHRRPKFCHSMQSTFNTIKLKKTEEETISKAMLEFFFSPKTVFVSRKICVLSIITKKKMWTTWALSEQSPSALSPILFSVWFSGLALSKIRENKFHP